MDGNEKQNNWDFVNWRKYGSLALDELNIVRSLIDSG